MKIFQNKIFVGVICIIIAALFAFLFLPMINRGKSNTEKVFVLRSPVKEGAQIEESMIMEKEVGSYGLPKSTVKKKDEIVGKFSTCTITPDDIITESKLSEYVTSQELANVMDRNMKLVTVSLDSVAAAVGNNLKPGDVVSIYGYSNNEVVVYDELKTIEVYSVENKNAEKLDDIENDEEAEHIASTITLIASQVQAEKLIHAEYSGKVHAVFVRRRDRL